MDVTPSILILAGQRLGKVDPLAAAHGVEHKCLVPLLGKPLIEHMVGIVDAAFPRSPVIVSINDPRALEGEPAIRRLADAGRLTIVRSRRNLVESVVAAADHADYPLLITTGDNVLMSPEKLRDFHAFALGEGADGAVIAARKEDVLAAHPKGQPRFWEFRDGEFSGCNVFWMKDAGALTAAEVFRGGGQFLKFPRRFVAAFGLVNLIGFRLGLFTVGRMGRRVSRRFGKKLVVMVSEDGRHAIDVDTELSHRVAERLLRAKQGS